MTKRKGCTPSNRILTFLQLQSFYFLKQYPLFPHMDFGTRGGQAAHRQEVGGRGNRLKIIV